MAISLTLSVCMKVNVWVTLVEQSTPFQALSQMQTPVIVHLPFPEHSLLGYPTHLSDRYNHHYINALIGGDEINDSGNFSLVSQASPEYPSSQVHVPFWQTP